MDAWFRCGRAVGGSAVRSAEEDLLLARAGAAHGHHLLDHGGDVATSESPVTAESDDAPDAALIGPPVHRLGRHVQHARHLAWGEVVGLGARPRRLGGTACAVARLAAPALAVATLAGPRPTVRRHAVTIPDPDVPEKRAVTV